MTVEPAQTIVPMPPSGTYRLVPDRSSVTFTSRHMLGMGVVRGSFELTGGELTIRDPLPESTASAIVDAGSFDTGHDKRDGEIRSAKYLDVDRYPKITYTSTGLTETNGQWHLAGMLTAHGVAVPTRLVVTGLTEEGPCRVVRAETVIDRYAHGITAGKGMAARRLTLSVEAAFVPAC